MTTKVRVEPAGHHVLVEITDRYRDQGAVQRILMQPAVAYVDGQYTPTGQAPWEGYATTTRTISVVDLEPNDPRIAELSATDNKPV